ncbi:MAG: tetratricopeptide repeat protein, partial [Candidatus Marinimicrobia bacterium]|nr:tetratricopeptide repeat protein [Candidatus Neomarinimicrobiota bacterium]
MDKKTMCRRGHMPIKFAWVIACLLFPVLSTAGDYELLHEQGKSLYRSGDDAAALEVYRQILDQYPDDADALLFRGRLYAREGQYDLAEKDLLRVIGTVPAYLDAYEALATVYFWDRNLESARNILTQWIQRDMENPV